MSWELLADLADYAFDHSRGFGVSLDPRAKRALSLDHEPG